MTQPPPESPSGPNTPPSGSGGMPVYGQGAGGWPGAGAGSGYPGYGPGYGGHGGYGHPAQGGWGPPVHMQNGLGLAAMICGIVGAVLSFVFIGIIPAVLGIIFGAIGIGRARRGVANNRGQALTGVITGIVGILAFALVLTITIIYANKPCSERYNTNSRAYQICIDNANR